MGPTQRKLLREIISRLASQTLWRGCFSNLLLLQAQSALRPSEGHCSLMLEEAICLATIGPTHRLTERTHKSGLTWDLFFLNFARTLFFFQPSGYHLSSPMEGRLEMRRSLPGWGRAIRIAGKKKAVGSSLYLCYLSSLQHKWRGVILAEQSTFWNNSEVQKKWYL